MIVSIVGRESEIPADMLPLFENPDKLLQQGEITEYTWADRIRVIPYKVIGQNHQLLTAIKPDVLQIHKWKRIQGFSWTYFIYLSTTFSRQYLSMYCSSENVNREYRFKVLLNIVASLVMA